MCEHLPAGRNNSKAHQGRMRGDLRVSGRTDWRWINGWNGSWWIEWKWISEGGELKVTFRDLILFSVRRGEKKTLAIQRNAPEKKCIAETCAHRDGGRATCLNRFLWNGKENKSHTSKQVMALSYLTERRLTFFRGYKLVVTDQQIERFLCWQIKCQGKCYLVFSHFIYSLSLRANCL